MMLSQLALDLQPSSLRSEARRLYTKYRRKLQRADQQVVTLEPVGAKRGDLLFSYIIDPFLLDSPKDIPYSHTHFWESWTMAAVWTEMGYRVDAVSWQNRDFVPRRDYDVVIDVRQNLERWAPSLAASTVKVLHLDTAHHSFHNRAQIERLQALEARRGHQLRSHKMLPETRAIEVADVATVLGNSFTQETYAFAGTPLLHIPISVPQVYELPERDLDRVRRSFLWFGSGALVHKGLDLTLEAFAGLDEFELTVCGPIRRERDFERAYFHELYECPNIHTLGWVDVAPKSFLPVAQRFLGLVYPSCSEGGGSSVYTCMHAGMVPVINREVSVDIDPSYGVHLEDVSVAGIRAAVRQLAARPDAELRAMARAAWTYARKHHTKEHFRRGYRQVAEQIAELRT